ncbi:MAG: DNA repair protein [Sulfitobacter sp.]|nr:DNA repair protein [Sulfitobacter sp.]
MQSLKYISGLARNTLQFLALALFALAAVFAVGATVMAALGLWPWLEAPLSYGGEPVQNAGMFLQIGLTLLVVSLCVYLPTNTRVLRLERSHRSFQVGMNDVARAYAAVHAADRKSTFELSSEFDAVRERLAYLRDHPDLSTLEPQVLELAAQMSHLSSELASVYSDEKINRARSFLKERQGDVELFNSRLDQAKQVSTEMKHWLHEVELEESVAAAQLDRLRAEMAEIMPELGLERTVPLAPELEEAAQAQDDGTRPEAADETGKVFRMPKAAE